MTDRILEFLSHLLKIGKEQLFLKSVLLRNKVPIKPVLGLTGLGVLFMAVRPLLTQNTPSEQQIDSTITHNEKKIKKEEEEQVYDLQKTLYLMREKEKQLKHRDGNMQIS